VIWQLSVTLVSEIQLQVDERWGLTGLFLVTIECTKEGIKFSSDGEIGKGAVTLKASGSVDSEDDATVIELQQSVSMTFSIKYLVNFTKATPLSTRVSLNLSSDVPLLVDYKLENLGYVRYYLAPKIGDEN
jgi:proliferating cell nuclear antigen